VLVTATPRYFVSRAMARYAVYTACGRVMV
jgi:hypothetical protein